jgi:hypothetical protein
MTIVTTSQLKVGNRYVKYPGGTKSFKVLSFEAHYTPQTWYVKGEAEDGRILSITIPQRQFKLIEEKETTEMSLLQIKGTEVYGIQLALNSAGKAVFEVKGTGEIRTVDPELLEEVIPYSVGVRFISGDASKTYHYWTKEGDVSVGDIVFLPSNNAFVYVYAVNTKSRAANKNLKGVVLTCGKTIGE